MTAFTSPYGTPWARLVANVTEDGECWIGAEKSGRTRGGYLQTNWRINGKIRKFSAHVLTWVAHESGVESLSELADAYDEFRASGLELDHTCCNPACRRPIHLEPMTHLENIQRRDARRSARGGMPDESEREF